MDDTSRATIAHQSTAEAETRRRALSDVAGRGLAGAPLHLAPGQEGLRSALVLWDYLCLDADPEPADCIFVMGGHDKGVAEHAARLYRQGVAPLVAVSGGIVNPPSMLERGGARPPRPRSWRRS